MTASDPDCVHGRTHSEQLLFLPDWEVCYVKQRIHKHHEGQYSHSLAFLGRPARLGANNAILAGPQEELEK